MRTITHPIGRLLKVATNQMARELANSAAQLDLTGQQMLILNYLGDQLENQEKTLTVSQTELELEFNIRRSTTTEILQRMEKRQLIQRRASTFDARQKVIELTEAGRKYLPQIKAFMREHDEKVLGTLTDAELAAVQKFFQNINDLESQK
ncbi:MarR family winged helix-turn-helix transcriptional regulator [Lactococcus kimchii]|uniref:MarR family winged helix-turn-helix transcriptional regulator n=1 Tax=Lactococcus sp. S-13 TaxID=2507158 RepID=UPI0010235453|nr:MarR family transcriptional regulator [Lactococcus sp. S-13]RZI48837.1 MarR family transcriptional regulator [Lactococcus sp. S-13]